MSQKILNWLEMQKMQIDTMNVYFDKNYHEMGSLDIAKHNAYVRAIKDVRDYVRNENETHTKP